MSTGCPRAPAAGPGAAASRSFVLRPGRLPIPAALAIASALALPAGRDVLGMAVDAETGARLEGAFVRLLSGADIAVASTLTDPGAPTGALSGRVGP